MKKLLLVFLSSIIFFCGCDSLGNIDDHMEEIAGEYIMTEAYDYKASLIAVIPPASLVKDGGKWYFDCYCPTSAIAPSRPEDVHTQQIRCEMEWNEAAGQYLFVNNEKVDGYDIFVFNPTKNVVTYGSIVWTRK